MYSPTAAARRPCRVNAQVTYAHVRHLSLAGHPQRQGNSAAQTEALGFVRFVTAWRNSRPHTKAKKLCLCLCLIHFLMLVSEVQVPRLDSQGRGLRCGHFFSQKLSLGRSAVVLAARARLFSPSLTVGLRTLPSASCPQPGLGGQGEAPVAQNPRRHQGSFAHSPAHVPC